MKCTVHYEKQGDLILAELPEPFSSEPYLLNSCRIISNALDQESYLVTEDKTYLIEWLLSSNESFLLTNEYLAEQLFEKQLELVEVKPNYELIYNNVNKVIASQCELEHLLSFCIPRTTPSVSEVAQALIRLGIYEANYSTVKQTLKDIFGGAFDFTEEVEWLCAVSDGQKYIFPRSLSENSYLRFSEEKIINSIIQQYCEERIAFTMESLQNFYESLNIPVSVSLKGSKLDPECVVEDGKLLDGFFIEEIRFQKQKIWGSTYDQKYYEGTIIRYYERQQLPFRIIERIYALFENCEFILFDDLVNACEDCCFDTAKEMKQYVYEEEKDGEVWCGCRPYYSFLE